MQGFGVIVQCSQLVDGAKEEISCSGMHLGHGLILTHGTLLLDLLKDKKAQAVIKELSARGHCVNVRRQPTSLHSILKDVQAKFKVILPSKEHVKKVVGVGSDSCASSGIENLTLCHASVQNKDTVPHAESGFRSAAARVDRIILQSGVYECVDSLMPASQGWKLIEESQSCTSSKLQKLITSTFVLLTLSEKEEHEETVIRAAREVTSQLVPVHKGNFVYVESSPFGSASPGIFLNSLSHGIVSNTCPKGNEVLLTDARCITGSEGAPVFVLVRGQRRPCALVISPFCWRGGDWLGITLLASLGPVLQSLLRSCTSERSLPKGVPTQNKDHHPTSSTAAAVEPLSGNGSVDEYFTEGPLRDVSKSVVCIKSGSNWGSGVVLSVTPGVILTCAHVTYKADDKHVTVLLSDGRRMQGTVIHQTQPLITCQEEPRPPAAGYSMWDLAVVVTSFPLPCALPLATSLPPRGAGVVMAGYGMFPSRTLPTATLSRGVISRVVTLPSSSLNLPPSVTEGVSRERLRSNAKNTTTSKNHFTGKKDCKISQDSTYCLMTLGRPSCQTTISKSVPVPVVMQTSCTVYAGSSGGPIVTVHPLHGLQVVGVVVCNLQNSNSVTFPHINLAVPIPTIASILNTFLETRDEKVLQYLDVECAAAAHLWGVSHSPRSCL